MIFALRRALPLVAMLSGCRCVPEADTFRKDEVRSVEYDDARLGGSQGRLLTVQRDGTFELECEANPPSRSPDGCRENEVGVYRGRLPTEDNERLFRLLSSPPPASLPVYDEHLSILAPGRGRRLFSIVTQDAREERLLGSVVVPAALERVAQELDRIVDVACKQPVAVLRVSLVEAHLEGPTRLALILLATNPGTKPIRWEAPNEDVGHPATATVAIEQDGRARQSADGRLEELERSASCSKTGDVIEVPPAGLVRFRATALFSSLPQGRTNVRVRFQTGATVRDRSVICGVLFIGGEVVVP